MTGEPAGLNMSLDDLIKKQPNGPGRAGARGGGGDRGLGVRAGAVSKPGQGFGHQGRGGQSSGNRGNFQGGGRGQGGGQGGSRGQGGGFQQHQQGGGQPRQQHQQQHHQSGGFRQQQQQQPARQGGGFQQQQGFGGQQQGIQFNNNGRYGGGFGNQQQQAFRQPAAAVPAPVPETPAPRCFLDEDTGDIVIQQEEGQVEIDVVRVGHTTGMITLNTDGYYTQAVLAAMNKALNVLQITIKASGPVENGDWQVGYGGKLLRYDDGLQLRPRNPATAALRGQTVLTAMQAAGAKPATAKVEQATLAAQQLASAASQRAAMALLTARAMMAGGQGYSADMLASMMPFQQALAAGAGAARAAQATYGTVAADADDDDDGYGRNTAARRLKAQGRL